MQSMDGQSYVSTATVDAGFDDAVGAVKSAFKEQGFGVLTEIDISGTIKSKIGADMPRYQLLGMCNPTLAHRALTIEPNIGVMLPCNVAVYEQEGSVVISAQDPGGMLRVTGNPRMEGVASEAADRIERAMEKIRGDLS